MDILAFFDEFEALKQKAFPSFWDLYQGFMRGLDKDSPEYALAREVWREILLGLGEWYSTPDSIYNRMANENNLTRVMLENENTDNAFVRLLNRRAQQGGFEAVYSLIEHDIWEDANLQRFFELFFDKATQYEG